MAYIAVTLNHFRALQAWASDHHADMTLDLSTFRVDVRRGEARCTLRPQFLSVVDGRMSYTQLLTSAVAGFVGWLPYRPIRWPLSTDKLAFKQFAQRLGLRVPKTWPSSETPDLDHVLKRPVGSFGEAVFGPYRAGPDTAQVSARMNRPADGTFAEQFIAGRNVKAWFWGGEPFHVHLHDYPTVRGDGVSRIEQLIARRTGRDDGPLPDTADRAWILSSLDYQGWRCSDIPPAGHDVWIDYRYGRSHLADRMQTESDSMLAALSPHASDQAREIGRRVHDELMKEFPLPVLFALDGVLDRDDRIWWLEANSNPVMPPTGYPLMLDTMFGRVGKDAA